MKITETQDSKECRNFLALIGRPSDKEMIISFSESEIAAIKTVIGILERASKLNEGIYPDIRAHEDVFFRAEVELKEILEDYER